MPENERAGKLGEILNSEEFSLHTAIGGWRGFVESVLPGLVFVVAFLIWGGFQIPVIASVATVVVLVVARLIARTPITQALSGVIGVALGAIWAWRAGDAGEFFAPGLWINAGYLAAVLLTMVIRWPLVGVVMHLLRPHEGDWRKSPALMRRYQWATAVLASMFVLRLLVQVPLYMAGEVAVLGTMKLAMGIPLTALTLWAIWFLVRNAAPPAEPEAPLPPTR
ncbi:DUF3159 domain-containing protein [Demequina zhanjiangensis]|uniref:DUF3159 domain-containing protein n=1 Tax=Demequina zhanjiangensis TaxID=3051659 RepID=A0ABT8G0V8_9MICO|nr:DUF3159 domain-containing protein [Demequina sp. SYSU T00b26]MDN4472722.1 DUF3159 domain-containing protein [Demequina sp. SYSU T00b26]